MKRARQPRRVGENNGTPFSLFRPKNQASQGRRHTQYPRAKGRNCREISGKSATALDSEAPCINNTSTLRAGCKSPPAVSATRASPRASSRGKRQTRCNSGADGHSPDEREWFFAPCPGRFLSPFAFCPDVRHLQGVCHASVFPLFHRTGPRRYP